MSIKLCKKSTFDLYLSFYGMKPISFFHSDNYSLLDSIDETLEYYGLSRFVCCDGSKAHQHWVVCGRRGTLRIARRLLSYVETPEQEQQTLGLLCNIPNCCIEKYIEYQDPTEMFKDYKEQVKGEDPYNLREENGKIVRDIIFHIPCSPDCERTKRLYEQYSTMMEDFEENVWNKRIE